MLRGSQVYSNRLEVLAHRLGKDLFGSHARPFERRLVIVPSGAMKEYLIHFFATDPHYQVFAGVRILPLADGFLELLALLSLSREGVRQLRIPSSLELSLRIEELIWQVVYALKDLNAEEQRVLQPLLDYVGSGEEKRISALSTQLSSLFSRYGLYGEGFLEDWLGTQGWQQWIWKRVYSEEGSWTYPIEALQFSCGQAECGVTQGGIYLFGFSAMPKVYLEFFTQLQSVFYILSPCSLFWEDVATDRERIGLRRYLERKEVKEKDLDLLEGYLRDTNPLLANWGKVGRDFAKWLEDGNALSDEEYIEESERTLLTRVRRDFLHLRNPREENSEGGSDNSIQIHSAVSLLREVEILYDQICSMVAEENPLMPKDVLVLAPDLDLYAPFIQTVFGAHDSFFAYSLEGVSNRVAQEMFEAVLHLLSIPSLEFSAESILHLFSFSSFLETWEFSTEDAALVQRWFKKANIRHDRSGLDRLLLGCVMTVDEETSYEIESNLWPCSGVAIADLPLLGKVIELISSLEQDLKPIDQDQKKSLHGWLDYLDLLISRYFTPSDGQEGITVEIAKLRAHLPEETMPALPSVTLKRAIEALKSAQSATLSAHNAQKVAFRPLKNGNITESKVIWILGMDEGSFPRSEPASSLCAMKMHKGSGPIPKRGDEDRYLFLESLLLAKQRWVASYQRIDPEDNKEQSPSLLIQELLQYVGESAVTPLHHPALPFDSRYFSKGSVLRSFSQKNYENACAYYQQRTQLKPWSRLQNSSPQQNRPFEVLCGPASSPTLIVDIKALTDLAKDPIRFYFQQALQIYMRAEEDENKDFILSPLVRSVLRRKGLKRSVKEQARIWGVQGKLPVGVFGDAAIDALEEEVSDLKEHLGHFELEPGQIFSVELSLLCSRPFLQAQDRWIVPALSIPMPDGSVVRLVGLIDNLTPRGLLFHGEDKLQDWVKCWPQLLSLGCLREVPFEYRTDLLLTKCGKVRDGAFSDYITLMQDYLAYYNQAMGELSLLAPDWIPSLLFESKEELEKAIFQSVHHPNFENPYLQWLKRRKALPNAGELFDKWSACAKQLYWPMLESWKKEGSDGAV